MVVVGVVVNGGGSLPPMEAQTMMMINKMATMTPMIIIIFMFCHQYFLLSLVAYKTNIMFSFIVFKFIYLCLKLAGALLEIVSSLIKLGELAVSLQHLLHINPHDVHPLSHLGLCLCEPLVALFWILTHVDGLVF